MDTGINPFTVHEATVAIWHAWHDGTPLGGPSTRHLKSALAADFRADLSIRQTPAAAGGDRFGDWRQPLSHGREWTIDVGYPLGAVLDDEAPVSGFLPNGAPLIIVIRFLDVDTGDWRVFQFHYAEVAEPEASPADQWMQIAWSFRAGHLEEFRGKGSDAPGISPRLRGVIEWCHAGRAIPCCHYDAEANAWTETDENVFEAGEETGRYVDLTDNEGNWSLSYMAARTVTDPTGLAGLPSTHIGWLDAMAFDVTESSGLTMAPGWAAEEGAPEPITSHPSGLHWDHPQVRFRFLGRLYATLSHGIFAMPRLTHGAPATPPMDYPLRIGRLLILPDGCHILPSA